MSTEHQKGGSKLNTTLISVLIVMSSVIGWFSMQSATKADNADKGVSVLQVSVSRLEGSVMPRPEIQVQLDSIRVELSKLSLSIVDLQNRQAKLEVELAQQGMILDRDYAKKIPKDNR